MIAWLWLCKTERLYKCFYMYSDSRMLNSEQSESIRLFFVVVFFNFCLHHRDG